MNEVQENHYDTATLANEQLGYAESLFFAIATLLEKTRESIVAGNGAGVALSNCEHAHKLARLGAMEAGMFADQFHAEADALSSHSANRMAVAGDSTTREVSA